MGEVAGGGVVIAVDGGNSKTDVAVLSRSGAVLAQRRGPGYSPHALGIHESASALQGLIRSALHDAGRDLGPADVEHTAAYLAGVDLMRERTEMHSAIVGLNWSRSVTVDNDTFALIRLSSIEGAGIAVVCGAGINCVAVDRDRVVRFPSLGPISGDWGGGLQLGISAMTAAAREADGRGAHTALTSDVLEHFGVPSMLALIEQLHFGEVPHSRLAELSPRVFAAAEQGDAIASALVARLAEEISSFAIASLRRLELTKEKVPVVLGGSILAARHATLEEDVRRRILAIAPQTEFLFPPDPPVLGAALLGLDAVHAGAEAMKTARAHFAAPIATGEVVR